MKYLAAAILIIFPTTILGLNKIYGLAAILAICAGFFYMYKHKKQIFPLSHTEKIIFFSVSLLYVSALITAVYHNIGLGRSSQYYTFVMIIPTYYFFIYCPGDKEKYLWSGLVLGALIALLISLGDSIFSLKSSRAHGLLNPNIFGSIAMLMGVMSVASIGWFKERSNWLMIVPIISMLSGVTASLLSLSRGVWVALIFIMIMYLWHFKKRNTLKKTSVVTLAIAVAIIVLYNIPEFNIEKRLNITEIQLNKYFQSSSTDEISRLGSVGKRLEMWKAALIIFKENPLFGAGWAKNYNIELNSLIRREQINPSIAIHQEAHSILLSTMAKGGFLGLVGVLMLFFIPFGYFIRIYFSSSISKNKKRIALAGMLLLVGVFANGLTESLLEKSRTINFMAFYLAVLLALTSNQLKDKTVKS